MVQRLIFAPKLLLPLAPYLRKVPFVRSVRTRMLEMNSEAKPRPPMDPALRRQLIDEFTPEIERLGTLIGRDLSAWLEQPAAEPAQRRTHGRNHRVKRPDFFIVGAFKAGTTALYEYLRAHPELFMSVPKEPMYFGQDLTPRYRRMTEDEYLALFKDAPSRPARRRGVALVPLLALGRAGDPRLQPRRARDHHAAQPGRRDVQPAQPARLQPARGPDRLRAGAGRRGRPTGRPPTTRRGHPTRSALLPPQRPISPSRSRAISMSSAASATHFVVFDDLVADPRAVYRSTLEFLGVDPTFEVDLSVYNPNKKPRSGAVQKLIFAPKGPMKRVVGRLRSVPAMHRVRDALVNANSTAAARQKMDPELRAQLTDEFAPQVRELGALIGRDLSAVERA